MLLKDNPATQLAWKIGQIYRLHMQNIAGVNENFGLYPGQGRILHTIAELNGSTQKEIAEKLNISPASMAVSIQRMQKAGVVEKVADKVDKRSNRIHITNRGRRTMTDSLSEFIRFDNTLLNGFAPEEISQLDAYLTRIQANLNKSMLSAD